MSTSGGRSVNILTLEQARAHQKNASAHLIDVREPSELKNHGVVEGAINVPVGYVAEAFAMDKESFQVVIGQEKPDSDDTLIFFCVKGIRAKNAADLVEQKFNYKNSSFYPGPFSDLQN